MEHWLIWSLVLFAVGILFTVVEVVVPSGGLLGLIALLCLLGSLGAAYEQSGRAAVTMAVVELICVPAVIAVAFKILPRTSLGKQLILSPPQGDGSDASETSSPPTPQANPFGDLAGAEGVVVATLRPSGTAEFGGRQISVVSDGQIIDSGSRVRVVMVEGNRVLVEPVKA